MLNVRPTRSRAKQSHARSNQGMKTTYSADEYDELPETESHPSWAAKKKASANMSQEVETKESTFNSGLKKVGKWIDCEEKERKKLEQKAGKIERYMLVLSRYIVLGRETDWKDVPEESLVSFKTCRDIPMLRKAYNEQKEKKEKIDAKVKRMKRMICVARRFLSEKEEEETKLRIEVDTIEPIRKRVLDIESQTGENGRKRRKLKEELKKIKEENSELKKEKASYEESIASAKESEERLKYGAEAIANEFDKTLDQAANEATSLT